VVDVEEDQGCRDDTTDAPVSLLHEPIE